MSSSQPARENSSKRRLPVKPSQENLRKQAKRLAKLESIQLAEAQHKLAREYGAKHWVELMHMVETMLRGADQLSFVTYKYEALPQAANERDIEKVRAILSSGEFTQHDLDKALARSTLKFDERGDIARLLLEHGADPDGQYGSNYGPIIFVTGECLDPDGLQFLIDAGSDVTFPPVDRLTAPGHAGRPGCYEWSYLQLHRAESGTFTVALEIEVHCRQRSLQDQSPSP